MRQKRSVLRAVARTIEYTIVAGMIVWSLSSTQTQTVINLSICVLCAVCCVLCAVVCALSEFLFEHLNSRREDSRCIRQGIRKMQNQREQKITTIRVKPWSARSAPVDRLKICPAVLQGKLPAILILQKSRQLEEVQIRLLHD